MNWLKRLGLHLWRVLPVPFPLQWIFLWLTTQKYLVGVSAIVFNAHGEVLLAKHTYRNQFPWGLPGGFLDRDEYPAQAIEREIEEETGLRVRALRPFVITRSELRPHLTIVFMCAFEGGTFRECAEISDARFFAVDALPRLLKGQREIIREAQRELNRTGAEHTEI
ncbi:MAG: NUDIX domain-containing protein [Chloroflexi bacterium]|nr:NUDIX domain-containing protein [Chloroflexota bacterium]